MPLYLFYQIALRLNTKSALLFKQDLARRLPQKGFFTLLCDTKCYRNLFYYRFRPYAAPLKLICHPDSSFSIGVRHGLGGGVFLQHSFRSLIIADSIGENFKCWHNCTVGKLKGELPIIGTNVSMSAGSMILGGAKIGDNVNLGAGCVVIKDVPSNCTVIGNPARIVKMDGKKVDKPL